MPGGSSLPWSSMIATWWPGSARPIAPGSRCAVGEVGDDDVRLGLPVAVVDRHAPALLEDGDDLGVEEVAGGDEASQAG